MELNQKFLEKEIESLEEWFVKSTIELIKWPIFVKQIEEEIKVCKDEEKQKTLSWLLENNKTQAKWHQESLDNIENILDEVYKLRK